MLINSPSSVLHDVSFAVLSLCREIVDPKADSAGAKYITENGEPYFEIGVSFGERGWRSLKFEVTGLVQVITMNSKAESWAGDTITVLGVELKPFVESLKETISAKHKEKP